MRRSVCLLVLAALFSVFNIKADDHTDALLRYAGNIHQFNSIFPQEKVYLQFDNTSYYSGEVIWFKAFVVNATTLQRARSKVLYVDLVSPTGVLISQQKLKIVGGQADGVLSLVDAGTSDARDKRGVLGLPGGFYEVRAYTNYMLNFNPETIFSRVFAVYELPEKEGNYYAETPVIKLRKSEPMDPRPVTEKLPKINCTFYPEGGHLIAGKTNRVAFKVTDDTGLGVDAQGTLDDGTPFSTVHAGMGTFTITPQSHRNSITLTVNGKNHTFSLPQTEQEGLTLQTQTSHPDSITLKISSSPQLTGKTLGMAMTCRGEIVDFCTIETSTGQVELTRTMSGIPEGVCRINIFDTDGTLYASRAIYHRNPALKTPMLEVTSDKESYAPFEKVNLKFQLKDGKGTPYRDRFCLSVRDSRGQGNILADDLRTSLLLSSDLKGFIENPSWYFDTDAPNREQALDLLMLVQGWERYDWQTITGQKEFRERHRLEESLTLNGWVMNSSGKSPVEGIKVLAALMPSDKRQTETYKCQTDSTGYFGFDIGAEFYDKARLSIDAHVTKKKLIGPGARIVFDRSMFPAIRAYQPQELIFTSLKDNKQQSGTGTKDKDDDLPTIINEKTGLLLPDVEVDEERMYVDYFTFRSYDVAKDVEIELDKGDYSTELYTYLCEKGYSILRMTRIVDTIRYKIIKDLIATWIDGYEPFFYIHDSKKYIYLSLFEDTITLEEDVMDPLSIDTRDIKSVLVYDRPVYVQDIQRICPLFAASPYYKVFMDSITNRVMNSYESKTNNSARNKVVSKANGLTMSDAMFQRRVVVDICIKDGRDLATRSEIFNINKRVTTVDGYSRPYQFYAPEYPDGPVFGDVDYRRTLYWNPNVITDTDGNAQVEFYNSSITEHFKVSAAGLTSSGVPYILDQDW
jgi:hypothetical protein